MNVDHLGRVSDFVAIPGCGLKCHVSQVETVLIGNASGVQINTDDSTASFNVTYHVHDEASDMPAAIEGQFANAVSY